MLQQKTVLQVCSTLGHGGSERVALDLARMVQQAGGRSIIAGACGSLVSDIEQSGIDVALVIRRGNWPHQIIANAVSLWRFMRRERVDLVHIHNRAPGWSALIAARLLRVPIISTYHSGYNHQNWFKALFNSVMARTDLVILNSYFVKQQVEKLYGFARERSVVLHNGIDLQRYDPACVASAQKDQMRERWDVTADAFVFLLAARYTRLKGHLLVVEAAAQLKAMGMQNFCCVFLGGDHRSQRYLDEIRQRIAQLDVADVVRVGGVCHEMPVAFAACDAVLSPSTVSENLPMSMLEASAMEKVLIGADIGGMREQIVTPPLVELAQATGILVPPNDAEALAQAMREVLFMAVEERQALGQQAQARVKQQFDLGVIQPQALALYARLL